MYVTVKAEPLTGHVHNHRGRCALHAEDGDRLYRGITAKRSFFTGGTVGPKDRNQIIMCEGLNTSDGPAVRVCVFIYDEPL